LRLCDSSANPYLATAAVIAAGLDGIEQGADPGAPSNFNHYNYTIDELQEKGIGVLPQDLNRALDALEADPLFAETLGADFINEFVTLKRMEWVEYQRHVSDWEVERYLDFY
jgi:glutamine synthetase